MNEPIELAPGLWRIYLTIPRHSLGGVAVYVIRDGDGFALIDTGMDLDSCWVSLVAQLASLGVPLSALRTVVATHGHADHAGLGQRLRDQAPHLRVLMHERDLVLVGEGMAGGEPHPAILQAWLEHYGFPSDEAQAATGAVDAYASASRLVQPDQLLQGGEELRFNDYRFEVIWTPGHTPGHVCLYEPDRRFMLLGDQLFAATAPNVRLMPYSPRRLIGDYLDSLRRVAARPVELALPAHGEPFEQLAARAEEVIEHQRARRERLLALLTDRPQTPFELAQQVWSGGSRGGWANFHGRLRRNAALTVAAHLELVAEEGAARRVEMPAVGFAHH